MEVVRERSRKQKPLFLMFTKMNCPLCDKLEAYFEKLSTYHPEFQFGRMDIEKNYPTSEFRHVIFEEEMPQFFMIYPGY